MQAQSNLSTVQAVVDYMRESTSECDWNDRCDQVKAANGDEYPSFWFAAIVLSGLAAQVSSNW